MSKRVTGLLMILMMVSFIFGGNTAFAAVVDGDVIVENYSVDQSTIYEGQTFQLAIKLKSNSGASFSQINLVFDTSADFQVSGSGNVVPANTDLTQSNNVTMLYTGGTNKSVSLKITYVMSNGDTGTTNTNLYINGAEPEDNTPVQPTDTTKYKPVLELGAGTIPEGKAGNSVTIPITLTNQSDYEAREIKITPVFSATDNPFEIDQMILYQTIDKLSAKKSASVQFQLKIDKFAEKKTYTLPLKIEYINAYKDHFSVEKLVYVNITNTNTPPQLVVREAVSNVAEIKEDQSFQVTFDIWNMGTLTAENVIVDLKPNENFYILDNVTKQYLFDMKGVQNRKVSYNLRPKKDLKDGTYGITVLLQHKGVQTAEEYTMYVTVLGNEKEEEKDDINIITGNINAPQGTVLTEQPFTISMDILNNGTTKAENVKVMVESGDKILPQSLNVLSIPEIQPGASVPVAFSFVASKDCENRSYPIKAAIEYKNGDEQVKKEQYIGVLIESTKTEETTLNTIPKIIISEYSTEPGMVSAGENFTLRMTFLNTSKLKTVQNMKVTLVVNESSEKTGSVFTPVQSSNTFYIDQLKPGESSKKEMVMYTIPDAQAKTYNVKAIFEYEYEEQKQLKTNNMEDVFGIPVVQPAKLETTDVVVSEPAFVGEPVYISSEFYNMGKVTLSNLMLKVEGEFDTKESNYFVGNFEMGNSDFYEASIVPLNVGETKGKLVYTFEDAAGVEHRIEKEFTVNAMEAAPAMNPNFPGGDMGMYPGMDPGMMEPQASKFPLVPVLIGGGVLVFVIVLIIILKRRKKKKEMVLDEDI